MLQLEGKELFPAFAGKFRCVFRSLLLEYAFHFAPAFGVTYYNEAPRLSESNARSVMGGDQHARQHFIWDRIRSEFAHVAAPKDRLVQTAAKLRRETVIFCRVQCLLSSNVSSTHGAERRHIMHASPRSPSVKRGRILPSL